MSDMLIAFARNGYTDLELVPKEYTWEQLAQHGAQVRGEAGAHGKAQRRGKGRLIPDPRRGA